MTSAENMELWFAGTGDFGALCLSILGKSGFPLTKIITLPPRPRGRKYKLHHTPVAQEAEKLGFPIHYSQNINEDEALLSDFAKASPKAMVVVDFGQFVREPYLSGMPWGCWNIHPSLLPAYRGAAPVQRAIMDGVSHTGVTVFQLVEAMDAGPVLAQETIPLAEEATAGELFGLLAEKGGQHLLHVLQLFQKGESSFSSAQDHAKATYAHKITKEELEIDWGAPSLVLHNKIRALNPTPGAYTIFNQKRLKIWKSRVVAAKGKPGEVVAFCEHFPVVACHAGALELLEVQYEGRGRQDGASWARGVRLEEGLFFGK